MIKLLEGILYSLGGGLLLWMIVGLFIAWKENAKPTPLLDYPEGKLIPWRNMEARVVAPYASEFVLETTKRLIDQVCPQQWGPHGLAYYCLRYREHLLNIILWFFDERGTFPEGWVCFSKASDMERIEGIRQWVVWRELRWHYPKGAWFRIPPVTPVDALVRCQRDRISLTGSDHGST